MMMKLNNVTFDNGAGGPKTTTRLTVDAAFEAQQERLRH